MRRSRFTIARWMAATAVLGVNIGLVRAFVLAERRGGEHLDEFDLGLLILFTLQLGLWRYLSTRGGRRRFWLGFEVSGLATTLALGILFGSDLDLCNGYTGVMSDLSYLCLPTRVDDWLMQHWDCFLAVVYFLPELLAAVLGGLLAACSFKVSKVGATLPGPRPLSRPHRARFARRFSASPRRVLGVMPSVLREHGTTSEQSHAHGGPRA